HRHGGRRIAGGEVPCELEGAIAVAHKHADVVGAEVVAGDVSGCVAVDIRDRHGERILAGGEVGGALEGAIAVAQQHADVDGLEVAADVGNGEVGVSVAVDIRHRHGDRIQTGGEVAGALEGAIAVAQQHADVAGGDVVAGV